MSPELVNQPFMRHARRRARERPRPRRRAGRVRRSIARCGIVEGRMFQPKLGEVVIGRGVAPALRAARASAATSSSDGGRGRVVGVFDSRRHGVRQRDLGRRDRRAGRHAAPSGCSGVRLTRRAGDATARAPHRAHRGRRPLHARGEAGDRPTTASRPTRRNRSTSWCSTLGRRDGDGRRRSARSTRCTRR